MMGDSKEVRRYLKRNNRCIKCQKVDSYTLIGRSYCVDCSEKMCETNKRYRDTHKEEIKQKNRDLRQYRKENRLCTKCGIKLTENYTFVTCQRCRKKSMIEKRKFMARNGEYNYPRGSGGICWQCNKNKVMDGKKLCKECYDKNYVKVCNGDLRKRKVGEMEKES